MMERSIGEPIGRLAGETPLLDRKREENRRRRERRKRSKQLQKRNNNSEDEFQLTIQEILPPPPIGLLRRERDGLEDAERARLERRKVANLKRRERRLRNEQLKQNSDYDDEFVHSIFPDMPTPRRVPLWASTLHANPAPIPTLHVDAAPIVYDVSDFDAYLEAVSAVRPDSARNEYIEQHAGVLFVGCDGGHCVESMDPRKEFYLVPWLLDPGEPKYYERLVVNNMCTRKGDYDATWSRDLLSDQQYVHFYSKLEECIIDLVPTWYNFVNCCFNEAILNDFIPKRLEYEEKVFCMAKRTEFSKLKRSDIYNCIMDLIQEKSLVKDRLHYSREFHLHLLECGFGEVEISNEYLKWGRGVPHPLSEPYEMLDYTEWLNQPGIREMNKEGKKTELLMYHDKKSKEDSTTRIRYLRLKLELAKSLGLIPEEADTN